MDLAWQLWKETGRTEHLTDAVHRGAAGIVKIWRLEQHHEEQSGYRFERDATRPTETLARGGLGTPVAYTGMTWSGFRCSDDACTYGYNIPANMYAAVVLDYMVEIADKSGRMKRCVPGLPPWAGTSVPVSRNTARWRIQSLVKCMLMRSMVLEISC